MVKIDVEITEPKGAAKQKDKIMPADVQTRENKYKESWLNKHSYCYQLKCSWCMS